MEPKINILIIGHGGHGKDTLAEVLHSLYGLSYKGSSQAASEIFIYDALKAKYGYRTPHECYADRVNHRAEWYDLICEYNSLDRARLAKTIMFDSNMYVGMRSNDEIEECIRQRIFDLVIGVYNPRVPEEGKDSFNINIWEKSDIIIPNAGTIAQLVYKAIKLNLR